MSPKELVVDIIKEQSLIIGEQLAISRAEDTGVVHFNSSKIDDIELTQSSPAVTIDKLVNSYEELFGAASVEVCISVIKRFPLDSTSTFLSDPLKARILGKK